MHGKNNDDNILHVYIKRLFARISFCLIVRSDEQSRRRGSLDWPYVQENTGSKELFGFWLNKISSYDLSLDALDRGRSAVYRETDGGKSKGSMIFNVYLPAEQTLRSSGIPAAVLFRVVAHGV